jgi:hypothetical protein
MWARNNYFTSLGIYSVARSAVMPVAWNTWQPSLTRLQDGHRKSPKRRQESDRAVGVDPDRAGAQALDSS